MSVVELVTREQRREHAQMAHECRATRHWMARVPAPPDWQPAAGSHFALAKHVIHYECQRCGTLRHIAIDHMGRMLASRYDWPAWYRWQCEERPTADQLRLWQVKQMRRRS